VIASETDLVQAHAIRPPYRVRTQQSDDDIGGQHRLLNLLLPALAGAYRVDVEPDTVASRGKFGVEFDGQFPRIVTPIA
jgi:hypothetical protein